MLQYGPCKIDLHRVELEDRAVLVHAVCAYQRNVELEPGPAFIRDSKDGRILVSHIAAVNIDRRVGVDCTTVGNIQIWRGDQRARMSNNHFVQRSEGCAEPDEDRGIVGEEFLERQYQPFLDVRLLALPFLIAVEHASRRRKGTTKAFLNEAVGVEYVKVPPDRLLRDPEADGKFRDGHRTVAPDGIENRCASLRQDAAHRNLTPR